MRYYTGHIIKQHLKRILKWSERYTRADMVYLTRGGFWVSFGQIVTSFLSLGLIVGFANLLPKETYGTYRYILSLAGVLNIFTLTGMSSAVARTVAAGYEGVFRTSVLYQLKWNVSMLVAFLVLSGYYFINGNELFATSFLILAIFVPPTLALNTYGAFLEGKRNFRFASIASIVSTSVYVSGAFVALLLSNSVVWIIAAYATTTLLATLFFYLYTVRKYKPPTHTDADNTLAYGRNLSFIRIVGPITSQIDKIILAHFWGATQLATYVLALAIPERATALLKRWIGIGFPKFSAKTPKEINTVFYRRIFQGMAMGTAVTFLYVSIAPYLFTYLLPQYLDGIIYSQILAISFIFAMPNRYISLLFDSQKMTRAIFINSVVQSLLAIGLYITLGIWGGILGLVIAYTLKAALGMFLNIAMWQWTTRNLNVTL